MSQRPILKRKGHVCFADVPVTKTKQISISKLGWITIHLLFDFFLFFWYDWELIYFALNFRSFNNNNNIQISREQIDTLPEVPVNFHIYK